MDSTLTNLQHACHDIIMEAVYKHSHDRKRLICFNSRLKSPAHIFLTLPEVSKYGVISGPYFPVFSPNTGKYGTEVTPYLDTFHAV